MKVYEIRLYLTEVAYKSGIPAYKQIIRGSRDAAIAMAHSMMKNSKYKYYEIVEK